MTPHEIDELTETFAAHELLTPDTDDVLTKSRGIAQHMRRRQWMLRTTGTVAVTAAVVAGAVALPGLMGSTAHDTAVIQPAAGGGAPAAASSYPTDEEYAAFFNAGYVYEDAQQLARLWHSTGDIGAVKAAAGGRLLDGETLPVAPSGTPATPDDLALQAYFNAGYDYQDAVKLAKMWHETDPSQVKVDAGKKLESGESLPIQPSVGKGSSDAKPPAVDPEVAAGEAEAVSVFFQAGYDYNDAVKLAKMWHETDPFSAKVSAGKKLERGETLPIAP
jgi:hypothetical protein